MYCSTEGKNEIEKSFFYYSYDFGVVFCSSHVAIVYCD